jgi:hypothetical protein
MLVNLYCGLSGLRGVGEGQAGDWGTKPARVVKQ